MAVINTNYSSLIAQGYLNTNNTALNKSIQRLSSGLRINSASDDASGLAISEKLRGQIRGLSKANMNAQDAVSFLQTAEGGMEVIGSMLQRMRELAVQSGNGTYTSNDRKELQKEVDQLKQEINRVSTSTEFNTKKLLTGDSAALWSTSDPSALEAVVRGAPAQGNYRIAVEATDGSNWVYKTDIMNRKNVDNTAETYNYNFSYQDTNITQGSFTSVSGNIASRHELTVNSFSAGTTGNDVASGSTTFAVYNGKLSTGEHSTFGASFTKSSGLTNSSYVVIEALQDGDISEATKQSAFKVTSYDAKTGEKTEYTLTNTDVDAATRELDITGIGKFTIDAGVKFAAGDKIIFAAQAGITGSANSQYQVDSNAPVLDGGTASANSNLTFAIVEMDNGGNISVGRGSVSANTVTTTASTSNASMTPQATNQSYLSVDKKGTVGTSVNSASTRVIGGSYPNGIDVKIGKGTGAVTSAQFIEGKNFGDLNLKATVAGTNTGETGFYNIKYTGADGIATTAANTLLTGDNFQVTFFDATTGLDQKATAAWDNATSTLTVNGNTVKFDANATFSKDDSMLMSVQKAVTAATTADVNTKVGNLTIQTQQKDLGNYSFYNAQMDESGNVTTSRIDLSLKDSTTGTIRFTTSNSNVADLNTKMKDISRFTNADGRMILDNTQELTLYAGNGNKTTLTVEGNDSVEDFRGKLNQAIVDLGLGTGNSAIDANLVRYVTEEDAQASGNNAVAGTFVFQSGLVGANGALSFAGDENLINALSVVDIQQGKNADLNVTVTDAHTGKAVGSDTISDNVLRGVISGIDVKIANPKMNSSYNSVTNTINFTGTTSNFDLHVVDNSTKVQIGANEGQTFDISIGAINTTSLEIDDAYVTTMDNSQKAITKFDQALEKVNGSRATIGAQINRLEYTMQNLATTRQNLTAAESRIRDLDVASESATFARNQVLVNSAVAMVAQANALPQTFLKLIS